MQDTILCPKCGCEIKVSDTLTAQIRKDLRQEFDVETRRKEVELAKHLDDLHQREQQLEASRQTLDQEVLNRVEQERPRLLLEAENKAQQSMALETQDLRDQLIEARNKVSDANAAELQWRKERRMLEDQKNELELTVNRRLDEERALVRNEAKRAADEEYRLKEADKDKLVSDLRCQISELKRKSEQGCLMPRVK